MAAEKDSKSVPVLTPEQIREALARGARDAAEVARDLERNHQLGWSSLSFRLD